MKIILLVRYVCLCGILVAGCLSIIGTGGGGGGGGASHEDRLVGIWRIDRGCTVDELIFSDDNTYSFEELDAEAIETEECPDEELDLDSSSGTWAFRDGMLYMTMTETTAEEEQVEIGRERSYHYYFVFDSIDKRLALFETEEDGLSPAAAVKGLVNTWTGTNNEGCAEVLTFNSDETFSYVGTCEEEASWNISGTYTVDSPWIGLTFTEGEDTKEEWLYYQLFDSKLFVAREEEDLFIKVEE